LTLTSLAHRFGRRAARPACSICGGGLDIRDTGLCVECASILDLNGLSGTAFLTLPAERQVELREDYAGRVAEMRRRVERLVSRWDKAMRDGLSGPELRRLERMARRRS
jgi:hypothetical protein